jgi:hypothetical protein
LSAAAPLRCTTCLQAPRNLPANALAATCAFCERMTPLIRSLYAVLPRTFLFFFKSSMSMWRSFLRNQPQNISTGFKSGDLGGHVQRTTFFKAWASRLAFARKNFSPSQSTVNGPVLLTGFKLRIASVSKPWRTAFAHSVWLVLRFGCQRTGAKPPSERPPTQESCVRAVSGVGSHRHLPVPAGSIHHACATCASRPPRCSCTAQLHNQAAWQG